MSSAQVFSRDVSREHRHIANRLLSIHADATLTSHLVERLTSQLISSPSHANPNCPALFANLRCGAWYLPATHRHGTCYFKSTDGHYGKWAFSLTRLNLHLLQHQERGVVIVDATQQGKRYPDALAKTVPLWCNVLNRALLPSSAVNFAENFAPFVPNNEILQMEDLLPRFVGDFRSSGLCTSDVKLQRPMRCFFIAANDPDAEDQVAQLAEVLLQNDTRRRAGDASFFPIVLWSASGDADTTRPRQGWSYVPGAADDHQSWAMGLDEATFWRHVGQLTDDTLAHHEVTELVKEIVASEAPATDGGKPTTGIKQRSRVQDLPTNGASQHDCRTSAPTTDSITISSAPSNADLEYVLRDPQLCIAVVRRGVVVDDLQYSASDPKRPLGDFHVFLKLRNFPDDFGATQCDCVVPNTNLSASSRFCVVPVDENAKFGLERSLSLLLLIINSRLALSERVVIVSKDPSVSAVVAIAVCAALANVHLPEGDNGSDDEEAEPASEPLADTSVVHDASTSGSPPDSATNSPTLPTFEVNLVPLVCPLTEDVTIAAENDAEGLEAAHVLQKHVAVSDGSTVIRRALLASLKQRGVEVTKRKVQWAHRIVINKMGSVFPSRAHIKQVNRFFLTK